MKKLSFFSLGLALLTLASCSQEEPELLDANQPKAITFVSSVAPTRTANVNLQKVQIAEGVEVGVFVKGTEGYIEGGDNAKLTADGSGNFSGETLYYPKDGSNVSVNAYAPYNAAFSGNADQAVSFSVAADQSTDAGYLKSDLLYGVPTGTNAFNKENSVVALNFAHKLAKLTITFTIEDGLDVDLKGATVNIVNTLPATTLKVSDGSLGEAAGSATTIKAVTFGADATSFQASAILVPQTVQAGSFIQVILADKMLTAPLANDVTFASGKAYKYNVNIVDNKVEIEQGATTVTDWVDAEDDLSGDTEEEELPEPEPITLTATFQTPGSNASYSAPTYTWTAGNSNLMTVFEFANGELAQYHTLKFKFTNLTDGASVRIGYYVGNEWTEMGNGFYSAGEKTVDLTALGVDLSTVTKIAFGGKSGEGGSCDIVATDVVLIGNADGTTPSDPNEGNDDGNGNGNDDGPQGGNDTLTATFQTPGSNASYSAPTYTWTGSTSNLMTVFEFSNGELAEYSKLTFTFSNLVDGPVRMGYYVGSTFTEIGNGYYSAGTKEVDLTTLGVDLSTVTKIAFGGRSNAGSCDILASDVVLTK